MFKLMDKKVFTILHSNVLFIWTFVYYSRMKFWGGAAPLGLESNSGIILETVTEDLTTFKPVNAEAIQM